MNLIVKGVNDGADIIWRRSANYLDEHGRLVVREVFMTQDVRDRLVAAFGEAWLVEYLAAREVEIAVLAHGRLH